MQAAIAELVRDKALVAIARFLCNVCEADGRTTEVDTETC